MALCYSVPDAVELCGCDDPVGRHRGRGGPTDSPRVEQCTLCRALGQGGAKTRSPYDQSGKCSVALSALSQSRGADRATVLCCSGCSVTKQGSRQRKVRSTSWVVSIDSHYRAHDGCEGLWFLTLVFNCSFVSYCSDSPLCIIVTTTYSGIEPPSRSASFRNAHPVFGVRPYVLS